jgi:hypothetical protein
MLLKFDLESFATMLVVASCLLPPPWSIFDNNRRTESPTRPQSLACAHGTIAEIFTD